MEFLKKLMFTLVNRCSKGWRYDDISCYFNVRVILSLFFSLNVFTILILIAPQKLKEFTSSNVFIPFYLLSFLLFFFVVITLCIPRKNIKSLDLKKEDEKRFFLGFIAYILISLVIFFILAIMNR